MIGSNGTCLASFVSLKLEPCIRVADFSSFRFQEQTRRVAISRIFDRFFIDLAGASIIDILLTFVSRNSHSFINVAISRIFCTETIFLIFQVRR